MIVTPDPGLPEVLLIEPKVQEDSRGVFQELFQQARYAEAGIDEVFVQDNRSLSMRGVLRGLHFQHPRPQGKLVMALSGVILDVAVDIRVGSPTFGRWCAYRLAAKQGRQTMVRLSSGGEAGASGLDPAELRPRIPRLERLCRRVLQVHRPVRRHL